MFEAGMRRSAMAVDRIGKERGMAGRRRIRRTGWEVCGMKPKLLGSLRAPGTVGMGWPDGRRVSPPSLAERDRLGRDG
jgi:hypothetical protein